MARKKSRVVEGAEREAAIEEWRNGKAASMLAKELGVHRNTVNNWLKGRHRYRVPSQEVDLDPQARKIEELELQVGALEGTVGRQAMEIRFFKGALRRVEGLRQPRSGNGDTASTPKSGA